MKVAMQQCNQYERSRIETLPFINLDPSNLSTIYTALCFAQKQCENYGLRVCPVTFDQPLYIKAAEIVASSRDLDKVIVRLGGFHLLMSYLGSICHIMTGSGLAELWEQVYAKGSVIHMLSGHAFSRSLRAHILTSSALIGVLLGTPGTLDRIDKDQLEALHRSLLNQDRKAVDVAEEECIKQLGLVISQVLDRAATESRTGKLWVQYIQPVALLQHFVRAERTGDWELHLYCIRQMIPHFHAAGHLHYAKSARLYLQQMESLDKCMPVDEYKLFTESGYFTIRRQDAFWAGNFSDQTIEQFLMRTLKTSGGMTHGRGITDSTLTKWVHALPRCAPICDALEQFTGVHTGTSEQHKDLRQSSQARDIKDRGIFEGWLHAHPPFAGYEADRLVSVATGIVASESVNCDRAVEIGSKAASDMTGKKFTDVSLRRNDKVTTMGSKDKMLSVRGQQVEVNPSLLFNRITCVLNNSTELEAFLAYELAPQPPSLFEDGLMRKPPKSSLGLLLKSFSKNYDLPQNCLFVVDGGYLLRHAIWSKPSTYAGVCQTYTSHILNHHGVRTTVVFDGYGSSTSTKQAEQRRRAEKCTSSDIIFDENMPTTTTQTAFLANSKNKQRLIEMVSEKMRMAGIRVIQAEADADTLIVSTALTVAEKEEVPVVVVGTDTDLLVMLVARASSGTDTYMKCCSNPEMVFRVSDIQDALGDTRNYLLAIHAITGCDTVSAIYRRGKRNPFRMVHKKGKDEFLGTFANSASTPDEVEKAGEGFILQLYGASKYASLNKYRHIAYKRHIGRSSLSSSFELASLPPTSAAAKQHSYRTYLTVQEWLGNKLNPTDWGWRAQEGTLIPVETESPVAPDTLLTMVSCGCKPDGCNTMTCSCKKLGLHCTTMCIKCSGHTCCNTAPIIVEELEDENETVNATADTEPDDEL